MYTFTREHQADALAQAARLTGSEGFMHDAWALSVIKTATYEEGIYHPVCICVVQNITTWGAEVHFAGPQEKWATKGIMRGLCSFLMSPNLAGYPALAAHIPDGHVTSQVFALKTGFTFEARLRGRCADNSDAIVMVLERARCRWLQSLGDSYGQFSRT